MIKGNTRAIVVSAMATVTDTLVRCTQLAKSRNQYIEEVDALREKVTPSSLSLLLPVFSLPLLSPATEAPNSPSQGINTLRKWIL